MHDADGRRHRGPLLEDGTYEGCKVNTTAAAHAEAVHKKDPSKGYEGFLTLGIDPGAENTGAGSGGGGSPPSGAPAGTPPSGAPTDTVGPSASASS